jgi:hypothetical protein
MGAPPKHPFYGNQYTDGGYIPGSFTYKAAEKSKELLEKSVEAVVAVVSEASNRSSSNAIALTTNKQIPQNIVHSTIEKISNKGLNKNYLIAVGLGLSVAVGGGILYIKKKSKAKKEALKPADFSVGICIKCDEPLIEATYVPGSEANNEDSCIVCKNCGERNFAWYPDEKE